LFLLDVQSKSLDLKNLIKYLERLAQPEQQQ